MAENKPTIGATFRETRSRLRKKILDGKMQIKESEKRIRCYFCGRLAEKGYELSEPNANGESNFYVDEECLKRARTFDYHLGKAFSMN